MKYFISSILLICCATAQAQLTNIAPGQRIGPGTNISNVVVGGGGGGGPALVFNTVVFGTSASCTTAPATNTTGSTLIVTAVRGYRLPYPLVTSSPANPYWTNLVNAGTGAGASGAGVFINWTNNPATSSSQTFTADGGDTGDTQYSGVCALGFSGAGSLTMSGIASNFITANSIQGLTAVTAKVHVVAIACATDSPAFTFSVDSGFTIVAQGDCGNNTVTSPFHFVVAYKIESGAASSEQPTFTKTAGAANPTMAFYHMGWQ